MLFTMRAKIYGILLICLVCITTVILFVPIHTLSRFSLYSSRIIHLENKTYQVFVADSDEERYQGLSDITDKTQLEQKDGMVFVFPTSSIQSFVNRRTYLNLKIYWLQDEIIVGTAELPALNQNGNREVIVSSPSRVNEVVEIIE